MVKTLVFERGDYRPHGVHGSMGEASASLPPGAYTTLRTYDGRRVLSLARHVERLNESSGSSGETSLAVTAARAAIRAALDEAPYPESRLRLTYAPPRLFVSIERFEALPEALYREGVQCATVAVHRDNPHAKDTRFIATAAAAHRQLAPGVHEGLLLAEDGAILEGLSSSFFAIVRGFLRSEEDRALLGVTRALVLELARPLLPISRRAATRAELPDFAEAFITSVSRGILPVAGIDGRALGDGRPGAITRELMLRFARLETEEAESVDEAPTPRSPGL